VGAAEAGRHPRLHRQSAGFVFIGPNAPVLDQLAAMVDGGRLRPVIGAEFGLDRIVEAHALSESGRAVGKIVLYVGRP